MISNVSAVLFGQTEQGTWSIQNPSSLTSFTTRWNIWPKRHGPSVPLGRQANQARSVAKEDIKERVNVLVPWKRNEVVGHCEFQLQGGDLPLYLEIHANIGRFYS